MTKAIDVFRTAISLTDNRNSSGDWDISSNKEYKDRTLDLLNTLRGELFPYSDTYAQEEDGTRPIANYIKTMESAIDLDDYICQTIMPYGLAALLMASEDPDLYQIFNRKYMELKEDLKRGFPTSDEDIEDVYSQRFPYNDFGRW